MCIVHRYDGAAARMARDPHPGVVPADASPKFPEEPVAFSRAALRLAGRSDGGLRAAVSRGDLVRPLRGAYVTPAVAVAPAGFYRYRDADEAITAAHAALAVLPVGAALADETAAFVLAGVWPPDTRPRVVVPSPALCTRRSGTLIREADLPPDDVVLVDGLRVTNGTRTAIDLARRSSRPAAVSAVDALLHEGVTCADDLCAALHRWTRHRGVLQAREVVSLADGRAESPGESRIRLALIDAGLSPIELQVPVCGGRYRVDLVVRERMIIEYEGSHHDQPDTQLADRRRFNALATLPGLHVLRYSSRDLIRLHDVVAEVRSALAR